MKQRRWVVALVLLLSMVGSAVLSAPEANASLAWSHQRGENRPVTKGPWTELTPIQAPGFVNAANDKPVVASRSGLSVLLWRDSDHASSGGYGDLWSWVRHGQGSWGTPTKLANRASEHNLFRVSVGPSGAIVVAWLEKLGPTQERIRLRVMQPSSSRWSRPFTVANVKTHHSAFEGVGDLRVSVGQSTATVAWLISDGTLAERRFNLDGRLEPIETISRKAETVEFHLATTSTEEALIAFGDNTTDTQYAVAASSGPQVPFGPPVPLSTIPETEGATFFIPSYGNELAVNSSGVVAAIWSIYLAAEGVAGRNALYVDVRPSGSTTWPPPMILSSNGDANSEFEAQIQADSDGRFRVLAATNPGAASRELTLFTSDPYGDNWMSQTVTSSLGLNDAFRLGAGGDGRAAVLYERGVGHRTSSRLFAAMTRGPSSAVGKPILLDKKNYRSSAGTGDTLEGGNGGPAVTVTPEGTALAAWIDGVTIRTAVTSEKR